MTDTLIFLLAIALIVSACANIESHWRSQKRLRRLEMQNHLRLTEIAALDRKLEQYIATDERVMELWPEEQHGR